MGGGGLIAEIYDDELGVTGVAIAPMHWTAEERRALADLLRAKEAPGERPFLPALQRHARFRGVAEAAVWGRVTKNGAGLGRPLPTQRVADGAAKRDRYHDRVQ
jgi:hypothetical protein